MTFHAGSECLRGSAATRAWARAGPRGAPPLATSLQPSRVPCLLRPIPVAGHPCRSRARHGVSPPISSTTSRPVAPSPGRRPGAGSTVSPAVAASTSRTKPSTVTPPAHCAPASPSGGSRATAARATSPTPDLRDQTNRFANVLDRLGVGKGDVVVTLAGRIPELYIAALGTLKNGSVFSPFFSAFGPEPIQARMNIAGARVLVTTEALYQQEGRGAPARTLPSLEHVLLVGDAGQPTNVPGHARLPVAARAAASPAFAIAPTDPEDTGAAALHERHDGDAQGRDPRARGGRRASRHRHASRSTCTPRTSSGARPIRAGSRAPRTASSRRSRTA